MVTRSLANRACGDCEKHACFKRPRAKSPKTWLKHFDMNNRGTVPHNKTWATVYHIRSVWNVLCCDWSISSTRKYPSVRSQCSCLKALAGCSDRFDLSTRKLVVSFGNGIHRSRSQSLHILRKQPNLVLYCIFI